MTRLSGQFDECRETALDTFEIGRDVGGHRSYRVVGQSQTEAVLRRATG